MVCRVLPMGLLLVVVLSLPGRAPAQDTAPTLPPGDDWQRCSAEAAGLDPALLQTAVAYASEHETKRPRDYSDQVRIFGRPLGPLPAARGGTNGLILRRGCLVAEFGDTTRGRTDLQRRKELPVHRPRARARSRADPQPGRPRRRLRARWRLRLAAQPGDHVARARRSRRASGKGRCGEAAHVPRGRGVRRRGAAAARAARRPAPTTNTTTCGSTGWRCRCSACGSGRCPTSCATK